MAICTAYYFHSLLPCVALSIFTLACRQVSFIYQSVRETETICQLNLSLCFAMHVFINHFAVGSKMIDGNEGGFAVPALSGCRSS